MQGAPRAPETPLGVSAGISSTGDAEAEPRGAPAAPREPGATPACAGGSARPLRAHRGARAAGPAAWHPRAPWLSSQLVFSDVESRQPGAPGARTLRGFSSARHGRRVPVPRGTRLVPKSPLSFPPVPCRATPVWPQCRGQPGCATSSSTGHGDAPPPRGAQPPWPPRTGPSTPGLAEHPWGARAPSTGKPPQPLRYW